MGEQQVGETISDRARALFAQSRKESADAVQAMRAERNSAGTLYSGATIKRIAEIHSTVSQDALNEATESISKRVHSRGYRWQRRVQDVRRELDAHLTATEQTIKADAGKISTDGPRLIEPLFEPIRKQLHRQLDNYREGWTGTPGKPWSERHKVTYTLLAALGGAAASRFVEAAVKFTGLVSR